MPFMGSREARSSLVIDVPSRSASLPVTRMVLSPVAEYWRFSLLSDAEVAALPPVFAGAAGDAG